MQVANAVGAALERHLDLRFSIKPPNDVLVNGRKLCGVLCSSRVMGGEVLWVLAGIGLNTNMRGSQLPIVEATSLWLEGFVPPPSHQALLEWILPELTFLR